VGGSACALCVREVERERWRGEERRGRQQRPARVTAHRDLSMTQTHAATTASTLLPVAATHTAAARDSDASTRRRHRERTTSSRRRRARRMRCAAADQIPTTHA
jgi:hypothetical protein